MADGVRIYNIDTLVLRHLILSKIAYIFQSHLTVIIWDGQAIGKF